MVKDVMIGDKAVAMAANAASPIFFKKLFHKDMLRVHMGYLLAYLCGGWIC